MSASATKARAEMRKVRHKPNRPWADYPLGSFALGKQGGRWERTASGWEWCYGGTSPAPTGPVTWVMVPPGTAVPGLRAQR